jgi:hypothetical protein
MVSSLSIHGEKAKSSCETFQDKEKIRCSSLFFKEEIHLKSQIQIRLGKFDVNITSFNEGEPPHKRDFGNRTRQLFAKSKIE